MCTHSTFLLFDNIITFALYSENKPFVKVSATKCHTSQNLRVSFEISMLFESLNPKMLVITNFIFFFVYIIYLSLLYNRT